MSIFSKAEAESAGAAREWSLAQTIWGHAQARPETPMLTYSDRTITYAEMDRRSSQLARGGGRQKSIRITQHERTRDGGRRGWAG